eukprot:TRINITY_DN4949_c0_g1_i2.p1 TRINITY_DN4949_c0_g1~~TRINITY_DN4949_c0_g1_i2.p1  ORF type:complete len:486 (-),score=55.16 TRINITY_DN4949_c0_g1_i2:193-1650(-)
MVLRTRRAPHEGVDATSDETTCSDESGTSETDCELEVERFAEKEILAFNTSSEGKTLCLAFLAVAILDAWTFQTLLMTQNYVSAAYPAEQDTIGIIMLMCGTWPMLGLHCLLCLTGVSRKIPYFIKVGIAPWASVFMSIFVLIVLLTQSLNQLILPSFYAMCAVASLSQAVLEPSIFEMAGLMPSTFTTQLVQLGLAVSGVAVITLSMLIRLLSSGIEETTIEVLKSLTVISWVLVTLSGVSMSLIYFFVIRPSSFYRDYVEDVQGCFSSEDSHHRRLNARFDDVEDDDENLLWATCEAARHIWPSLLANAMVFFLTVLLWPIIPGLSCVTSPSNADRSLQSWWLNIILLTFNIGDLMGKSEHGSLNWGSKHLTPLSQLFLALLRAVLFTPIILLSSAPQSYSPTIARWVNFAAVLLLGLSNGWLSTVTYMRAPKALPRGTSNCVAEQASALVVMGMYVGLCSGCTAAFVLTKTILAGHVGVCFA